MKRKNNNLENAVIEIDEVEFFITKEALEQIKVKSELIVLRRLIDHENRLFPLKLINKIIKKEGIVDHL